MDALVVSITLSASLFALTLSVISIVFHWIKRKGTPDIDDLWSRLQSVQTQHLDLLDKVEHWRKRDAVRKARDKVEENRSESEAGQPADPVSARKRELRRRANLAGLGVAGNS